MPRLVPVPPVLIDVADPVDGAPDPLIGTTFAGRYRIEALLGKGGMGSVYRATQLAVDRQVALKILLPEVSHNRRIVERFEHEARIVAALHHPNIIALHDFGHAEDGRMFLVTELLQGESLAQRIARDVRLDVEVVIDIGAQVLEALIEAHAAGIIHRDLKPENIFVGHVGRKTNFVKLLDFGIAKVSEELSGVSGLVTRTGVILGSPTYMAPEQARAKPVSPQTDLYALGLVLYEMLAGRRAFDGDSQADLVIAHVRLLPPPIERDGGELTGPLVDLIMQCLEKDPARRPASATAMLEQLEACRTSPLQVKPLSRRRRAEIDQRRELASLPTNMSKTGATSRRPRGLLLGLAGLVIGGGVAALVALQGSSVPRGEPIARDAAEGTPVATADAGRAEPGPEALAPSPEVVAAEPSVEVVAAAEPSPEVVAAAEPSADVVAAADPSPEVVVARDAGPVARHRVWVESEPAGALVFRDGQRLGVTALAIEWAADAPPPLLVLKKGTLRATLRVDAADDGGTRRVVLAPAEAPPAVRAPPARDATSASDASAADTNGADTRAPSPTFEMLP